MDANGPKQINPRCVAHDVRWSESVGQHPGFANSHYPLPLPPRNAKRQPSILEAHIMRLADWPPIPHLAPGLTPTRLLTWSESFRLPLQEALVVSFFPLEGCIFTAHLSHLLQFILQINTEEKQGITRLQRRAPKYILFDVKPTW